MSKVNVYRQFLRCYRSFQQIFPYFWVAGCVGWIVGLGEHGFLAVGLVTIYPAIIGWLVFNGTVLLLGFLRQIDRVNRSGGLVAWLIVLYVLLLGVGCVTLAAIFVHSIFQAIIA